MITWLRFRHRWLLDDGTVLSRWPSYTLTRRAVGHRVRLVVTKRRLIP